MKNMTIGIIIYVKNDKYEFTKIYSINIIY